MKIAFWGKGHEPVKSIGERIQEHIDIIKDNTRDLPEEQVETIDAELNSLKTIASKVRGMV